MLNINLFKLSQVFKYTLYLHDVQKRASVSYSSLSNEQPWSYFLCPQINENCFRKCDNHKTIEILCCESKNLKGKAVHLFKVMRILLRLLWAGCDTGTLIPLLTFLSYLFTCVHNNQIFFHFWMLVLHRNGKKQKFTNQNTELGTLRNGFAEL